MYNDVEVPTRHPCFPNTGDTVCYSKYKLLPIGWKCAFFLYPFVLLCYCFLSHMDMEWQDCPGENKMYSEHVCKYIHIYMIYNYTYIAMSCYRIYIMMTHTSFIILWKQFAVLQKSQQVGDYQRMKDIMPDTNAWLHAWIRSAPGCML